MRRALLPMLITILMAAPAGALPRRTTGKAARRSAEAAQSSALDGLTGTATPRIGEEERQELERILPIIATDPAQAAQELEALSSPEGSALVDVTLGNVLLQLERLEEAAEAYQSAADKAPSWTKARRNLGIVQARLGLHREAVDSLSRVIQAGEGDALAYGLLGHSHGRLGSQLAAESAFRQAVLLQPEVVDWKLGLAQAILAQGKHAEAASLCGELIERDPARAELWLLQANAYIGMGRLDDAALAYEILDRMGAATPESLLNLGDIHVNSGNLDLAAQAYVRAVQADPAAVDAHLERVNALAQRAASSQVRQVLDALNAAAGSGFDEEQRKSVLRVSARLAVADGEGGQAVTVLEELVRLDPMDGEALLLLGRHHAEHDDPERALFLYERAFGLPASEAEARVRAAQVLVETGRMGDAIPHLQRAQELDPRDDVGRYLEEIRRLARSRS